MCVSNIGFFRFPFSDVSLLTFASAAESKSRDEEELPRQPLLSDTISETTGAGEKRRNMHSYRLSPSTSVAVGAGEASRTRKWMKHGEDE
jgi:hypothetical protein